MIKLEELIEKNECVVVNGNEKELIVVENVLKYRYYYGVKTKLSTTNYLFETKKLVIDNKTKKVIRILDNGNVYKIFETINASDLNVINENILEAFNDDEIKLITYLEYEVASLKVRGIIKKDENENYIVFVVKGFEMVKKCVKEDFIRQCVRTIYDYFDELLFDDLTLEKELDEAYEHVKIARQLALDYAL